MPLTLRLTAPEIGPAFEKFAASQVQAGVRLICVEGLMGVGKSFLLKFAPREFATIELDSYLARPASSDRPWIDQVLSGGAVDAIQVLLDRGQPLVIEGVMCWPIIETMDAKRSIAIARVYVKKLSRRVGEPIWSDGESLEQIEDHSQSVYFRSIRYYHAVNRPWLRSDLILERLESTA
jgi:hypothetical protein